MLVYKLFYKLAKFAVRELAQNPDLQAKAASFVKERVVPKAKAGWTKAKPKLDQAKDTTVRATKDIADVVRENNPKDDPKKFLSKATQRFRDRTKR